MNGHNFAVGFIPSRRLLQLEEKQNIALCSCAGISQTCLSCLKLFERFVRRELLPADSLFTSEIKKALEAKPDGCRILVLMHGCLGERVSFSNDAFILDCFAQWHIILSCCFITFSKYLWP